jgi:hypothetical protein
MPGEKWRTYQSPQGGYSVDFPIDPNPDLRIPGVKTEPNVHTEGGILWKHGECYVVMYADTLPKNMRAESDDELLRAAVKEMASDPDVRRVVRDVPVTVSGFPGREVEFEGTDGGNYVARIVIADRRVFVAIAGGRFVRPNNANIRRFLDSFKVTDPTLRGGVAFENQQKEEVAKKEADRIAAEAQAAQLATHRAKENEAFRTAPHEGPQPGDPRALSQTPGDIIYLSLDTSSPDGIGRWGPAQLLLIGAAHGPGVRGNAAFLAKSSQSGAIRLDLAEMPVGDVPLGTTGFTLAGWYKARYRPFDLFRIDVPMNADIPTGVQVRVRVEAHGIVGRSHDNRAGPLEVSAPRPADDKWHHVAVVFDQKGRDTLVSVYIDGKKGASGTGARTHLARSWIWVGYPRTDDPDWTQPLDSEGKPAPVAPTDFIGAIDECCVIDRPLSEQDVRKLAGLEPMPEPELKQYGPEFRTPFPVPDPNRFAGLKTHFPLNELEGVFTRDAAGGRVARAFSPERVVGPRGAALRITAKPRLVGFGDGILFTQDRFDGRGFGVAEGKPFTMAFWVRTEADKPQPTAFFRGTGWASDSNAHCYLTLSRNPKTNELGFGLINTSPTLKENLSDTRSGWKAGAWTHFAVTRDAEGKFRWSVNGKVQSVPGTSRRALALHSLSLAYGFEEQKFATPPPPFSAEFADFCIFDRDLTDDELAALAGQKPLPKKK